MISVEPKREELVNGTLQALAKATFSKYGGIWVSFGVQNSITQFEVVPNDTRCAQKSDDC